MSEADPPPDNEVKDVRMSDADIAKIEKMLTDKFPTTTPPKDEKDLKIEELLQENQRLQDAQKKTLLDQLPENVRDKYQEKPLDVVQEIVDFSQTLTPTALQRIPDEPSKPKVEAGRIGGFDSRKKEWK